MRILIMDDSAHGHGFTAEEYYYPRYSITDHWIQESKKWIFDSGLFWAVGAAEKQNPNCHKYATFEVVFLCFHCQKNILNSFLKYCSARTKKFHTIEERKF